MSAPLALVYRGPAAKPAGCSEAVAALLREHPRGFRVRYIGPREDVRLSGEALSAATIYAQPGGGTLRAGYRTMRRHRREIRDYVAGGGRYLGFCLGGYLAGATPGFALLPGDTDRYIATRGATVRSANDTLVELDWRGTRRTMYFQDGAVFRVDPAAAHADEVTVLARYFNREIAALAAPFGAGAVGVVGPHPEATPEWYAEAGLASPDGATPELAYELVDAVLPAAGTGATR